MEMHANGRQDNLTIKHLFLKSSFFLECEARYVSTIKVMENDEVEPEESSSPLHKVFVDLSLENDLEGEELEWFKSKISPQKVEDKRENNEKSEPVKVKIITEYKVEKPPEKPNKLILKLGETNTIFFFSLNTIFSQDNPEDAERVRRENETYKMKKTKKEIIRKRCMADAQTPRFMVKSKESLTEEIVLKNVFVFASEWDMYDTYKALEKSKITPKKYPKLKRSNHDFTLAQVSGEKEVENTFNSPQFKYASLVAERLLASNCFQYNQSIFKKDFKTRYDTGPTQFKYNIEVLWSFQKDLEEPLTVTDMDWNPLNKDLLAVGYGSLDFEKPSSGLICVWSAKNPRQPERQFQLKDSVTCLHYSKVRPNFLAVGTRNGSVYVLDVSSQALNIRILGRDCLKTRPGPVWKSEWFVYKELVFETEELLVLGESGVLSVFSMSPEKDTKGIALETFVKDTVNDIRISCSELAIHCRGFQTQLSCEKRKIKAPSTPLPSKGIYIMKLEYVTTTRHLPEKMPSKKRLSQPYHEEVFDRKTFSGLSFSISSDRNFCNVSTKEGVIVKCNLRNPSMTDAVFLAHDGPVYKIQHSPVTDLIYLTCGADWKIKIWMEGITEPLITLQQKAPVTCASWSPTIPTLIASVGELELCLWDIGRSILSPMSVKSFEDCKQAKSTLLFSSNGANLMVGCEDGLVLVVHLSELPRIPFLQKEALVSAIRRVLLRNKNELFRKFCRAVTLNQDKLKTNIIDNLQQDSKLF